MSTMRYVRTSVMSSTFTVQNAKMSKKHFLKYFDLKKRVWLKHNDLYLLITLFPGNIMLIAFWDSGGSIL